MISRILLTHQIRLDIPCTDNIHTTQRPSTFWVGRIEFVGEDLRCEKSENVQRSCRTGIRDLIDPQLDSHRCQELRILIHLLLLGVEEVMIPTTGISTPS